MCAGSVGQVYELRKGSFKKYPILKLDGKEQTIQDIAGPSPKDFTIVTSEGFGARFDGARWHDLHLPTNVNLTRICRFDDSYAVVGKEGTILVGSGKKWRVIDPIDSARNYWGVAAHGGAVYAAHLGGIDILRNGKLKPLRIPDAKQLEFTALREGSDGVWSFAGHTVGFIKDDQWNTVVSK
jgi:hypothetical protein